jgi:hypothetical protein
MANVEYTISWVVPEGAATGHWEDSKGQTVQPRVGMTLDPALCDGNWRGALKDLKLTAIPLPGDILYHVVAITSTVSIPRIKGMR